MKNSLLPALIVIVALTAYSIGANNVKPKPTCCCEHTQQIANNIHELRIFLEKSFTYESLGDLDLKMPKFKVPPRQPLPTLPRR